MKYVFPILLLVFCLGCDKEKRQAKKDKEIIEDYIKKYSLNAQSTSSGLYYVIEVEGTGTQPTAASTVNVDYRGYLPDGTVFDQTATGNTFNLADVIEGWQEGIPLFKEGGKGKLLIPSALGYGSSAKPSIPANSVLIFDIELIDVL